MEEKESLKSRIMEKQINIILDKLSNAHEYDLTERQSIDLMVKLNDMLKKHGTQEHAKLKNILNYMSNIYDNKIKLLQTRINNENNIRTIEELNYEIQQIVIDSLNEAIEMEQQRRNQQNSEREMIGALMLEDLENSTTKNKPRPKKRQQYYNVIFNELESFIYNLNRDVELKEDVHFTTLEEMNFINGVSEYLTNVYYDEFFQRVILPINNDRNNKNIKEYDPIVLVKDNVKISIHNNNNVKLIFSLFIKIDTLTYVFLTSVAISGDKYIRDFIIMDDTEGVLAHEEMDELKKLYYITDEEKEDYRVNPLRNR